MTVRRDDVMWYMYMVLTCDGTGIMTYVQKMTVTYMSIRNTFLVRDSIREVIRNIIIYILYIAICTDVRLVWGSLRLAPISINTHVMYYTGCQCIRVLLLARSYVMTPHNVRYGCATMGGSFLSSSLAGLFCLISQFHFYFFSASCVVSLFF